MVTWTTYGSWLQGDKRRYVKDGKVLDVDEHIYSLCKKLQKSPAVKLRSKEKKVVHQVIMTEAERTGHQVEALIVCSNHVHLVARWSYHPIGKIVSGYKNAAMFALHNLGRSGRIWTRGYDKRYCFDEESLRARVDYVKRHK
jgi:REP element-mobilizing transposase RayT